MLPQFVSAKRGKNSSQLTVISYNMRYGTAEDGVNAWEFRKPATIKMIKSINPIFGEFRKLWIFSWRLFLRIARTMRL